MIPGQSLATKTAGCASGACGEKTAAAGKSGKGAGPVWGVKAYDVGEDGDPGGVTGLVLTQGGSGIVYELAVRLWRTSDDARAGYFR